MMKYAILVIFLVMLIITGFYFYGFILNKNLNKKKLQLGFSIQKNRYQNYFRVLTPITTIFGGLVVFAFAYRSPLEGVVNSLKNNVEYERIISDAKTDVKLIAIEKAVELDNITYFNQMIETDEGIIALTKDELVKYNINNKQMIKVKFNETSIDNGLLLYNDNIITYFNFDESAKIQIYNKNSLERVEEIFINSEIINVSLDKDNLNVFTYGDIKNPLKYQFTSSNSVDILEYDELDYVVGSIHKNVVCHTKINLKNDNIKQYGLFVSDLYYSFGNENIICTNVISKYSLPTSLVFKYDLDFMHIIDSKLLSGYIYYNPICDDDIYINSYLKNDQYIIYKLDEKLEILEINDDVIHDNMSGFYKIEDDFISFDNNKFVHYSLFTNEEKEIKLPDSFEKLEIIDINYNNQFIYIIASTEQEVLSIKVDLENTNASFNIYTEDDVFFTDEYIITISEQGIYNTQKLEEIGK